MPLFFLGTREWRNRQTRTVQVRVPVMEWGFNSPLAHDETADPSGSAVFVFSGCGLWPRWCSGRRRARPLCVPLGGGPPARSPHASLRLGVVDLEARPGPAATHRHRGQAPPPPINFARNSPAACSNIECASLELQRFGVSRKMTAINYVRNMGGGDVLAARGHRSQASCLEARTSPATAHQFRT